MDSLITFFLQNGSVSNLVAVFAVMLAAWVGVSMILKGKSGRC